MADESKGRQHYACIFYDTKTDKWYVENWEDGTGRDDGDIWDNDQEEWRYPNEDLVAGEEELDSQVWKTLKEAVAKMPSLKAETPSEEPDVIY
jgi:hypothetical protein